MVKAFDPWTNNRDSEIRTRIQRYMMDNKLSVLAMTKLLDISNSDTLRSFLEERRVPKDNTRIKFIKLLNQGLDIES